MIAVSLPLIRTSIFLRRLSLYPNTTRIPIFKMTMSTGGNQPKPANTTRTDGKKEVKILMLHGYTQSGPLFRSKTRAMEKLMAKSLSPFNLVPVLLYPTGPIKLSPSDIPGYSSSTATTTTTTNPDGNNDNDVPEQEEDIEAYSWYRRNEATGRYGQFERGMELLAETVETAGGVDGVVGFSQGGAVAAMVAAALETSRLVPSSQEREEKEDGWAWVRRLRTANGGKELRFSVVYSGFWAPPEDLQWLYEPKVKTPTLHYLGSLDSVVVESRSLDLIERCVDPVVVTHPGGHHVPVSRQWVNPIVGFMKDMMAEPKEELVESEDEFAALG